MLMDIALEELIYSDKIIITDTYETKCACFPAAAGTTRRVRGFGTLVGTAIDPIRTTILASAWRHIQNKC